VQLRCFWCPGDIWRGTSLFLVAYRLLRFFLRASGALPPLCMPPSPPPPHPTPPHPTHPPPPPPQKPRPTQTGHRPYRLRPEGGRWPQLPRAVARSGHPLEAAAKEQRATFASWAPSTAGIEECRPVSLPLLGRLAPAWGRILPSLPWCRSSGWASSCAWSAVKSAYREVQRLQMVGSGIASWCMVVVCVVETDASRTD
jgi:hypothetical protein